MIATKTPAIYSIDGDTLSLNFHRGQWKAYDSQARFVCILAGTQGGKTTFGPLWLLREMKTKGAGDYLVVSPTFPLLDKKTLPVFLKLFKTELSYGDYNRSRKVFTLSPYGEQQLYGEEQAEPTQIFFGYATDPDSLESATAKAAWLDECGQKKFKLSSFEAILRRLSIHMGRVLMTTTPYYIGWIKRMFWDAWVNKTDPDIEVIRFRSIDNPTFPKEEYERARRTMQKWKFDMFYNAKFTKGAGMIYDCFSDDENIIEPFPIPDEWPIFAGVDFGGVNTSCVKIAQDPATKKLYLFSEYLKGGLTAKQHAVNLTQAHAPKYAAGGAKSEGQWRQEFGQGGLPIHEPKVWEVEVGINRVYGAIQSRQLIIFNTMIHLIDEVGSYSRELDDEGYPTEKIENKNAYHHLDALRYIMSYLIRDRSLVW